MSDTDVKTVFSEYRSQKGTMQKQGYGLGLKLSKDLIVSNNGRIEVESKLKHGTKKTLTFPGKQ